MTTLVDARPRRQTAREPLTAWVVPALRFWPYLLVTFGVAFAFWPTITGDAHLPFDAEGYHFPLLRTVQDALASGELPGWNPYTYGGTPLLANAQSAWLYPPHLLLDGALVVLGRPLTPGALNTLTIGHAWLAAVSTILLAERRGMGAPAAAFAGGFVALCGSVVQQAQHIGMIEALAWLPLAVLAVDRLALGLTMRRIAALGACFALMLTSGFLPMIPACALLLLLYAVLRISGRGRALLGLVAGLALGSAFAAAAVLPVLALVDVNPPLANFGALSFQQLLTTIFPNAYGQWLSDFSQFQQPPGPIGLTNTYNYVGGAAVLLLPLAITSGQPFVRDGAAACLMVLASFGPPGAAFAEAVQALPSVGPLYRPEDVAYVAALPIALALAHGLRRPPRPWQLAVAGVSVAGVSLITFGDGLGRELQFLTDAPRRTLLVLALAIGAVVVATVVRDRRPVVARAALAGVAIIGVLELSSAVPDRYFINAPGPAVDSAASGPPAEAGVIAALQQRTAREQDRIAVDLTRLPAQWTGFPPLWSLPDVNGFHPQFSKHQLEHVTEAARDLEGQNRKFPVVPWLRPYYDALDVGYVLTSTYADRFAGVRGYELVLEDGTYRVYRVAGPRSRAYVVDPACLRRRGEFRFTECRTRDRVQARITGRSDRRLAVASSRAGDLLVTGDPWYPGWRVEVDGRDVPVERVGFLAGVRLPQGAREAEVSYRPAGLLLGAFITLIAIIGALIAVAIEWRRERSRPRPAAPAPARPGPQRLPSSA